MFVALLPLPEDDDALIRSDRTFLFFRSEVVVHGVTPIELKHEDSYRHTFLFHT